MMPIRVLHIIGNLRSGGAQMCLKHIVENNDDPEIEHYIYPLRSQQIDIPIAGQIIRLPYRNYDPRKFFAIMSLCKKYKINIIHAHLHKPIIGALAARFFMNVPVIVHEHGSIAIEGFQYSLYRFMLRLLKSKAGLFIAVSKSAAGLLNRCSGVQPERIRIVYNAVDLSKFIPRPEVRESLRREFHFNAEDHVIGYVGRLSYEKGPDILLNAFSLLVQKNPNYRLVFLGEGHLLESLQKQVKDTGLEDRVFFAGFRENVAEIMNILDVAAITSRKDAFPLTPLEFMSMKVPLVSCDVSGLAEIVQNEHNALVPRENTPTYICECIERLTADRALKERLVENASACVQNFSIPRLVGHVNEIYRDIHR